MYILIYNNAIKKYPYSIEQLKSDNSGTSFPSNPSNELLVEWGVFPVKSVSHPQYDPLTQNLTEDQPQQIDGEWVQVWSVSDADIEEIANRKAAANEQVTQNRLQAYRDEADPLFFKWQRGEATNQEWVNKVAEIKQRFPKVE